MDSVALDRMQPKFKHVEDSTLESAPESKIAKKLQYSPPNLPTVSFLHSSRLSILSSKSCCLFRPRVVVPVAFIGCPRSPIASKIRTATFRTQSLRRRPPAFHPSTAICDPFISHRASISAPIPLIDFPSFAPFVSGNLHVVDATRVATSAILHSFFHTFASPWTLIVAQSPAPLLTFFPTPDVPSSIEIGFLLSSTLYFTFPYLNSHSFSSRLRSATLHDIIDWMNIGIPQTNRSKGNPETIAYAEPLFNIMPALAERFYRNFSVRQLSKGDPETIAYAEPLFNIMPALAERFYRNFSFRQLVALPFKPPSFPIPNTEVQYSDGPRVATTDRALTSFLRLRSYIFDLVTLDLHSLTNRGHFKGVSELLELIYGNDQKRAKVMLAHTEEEEEPRGLWWVSYTEGLR
ncbi:hypothetical protein EDB85DRAFT_2219216 [Lactarius pseudohatsudake]|nr:hypothetical protein EDB85DRAFT_2219216 [Lactarius pseudohatsudake]